jgi:hypothetical protein
VHKDGHPYYEAKRPVLLKNVGPCTFATVGRTEQWGRVYSGYQRVSWDKSMTLAGAYGGKYGGKHTETDKMLWVNVSRRTACGQQMMMLAILPPDEALTLAKVGESHMDH